MAFLAPSGIKPRSLSRRVYAKLFPSDTIFFADAAPCLHSLIIRAMKFKLSGPWLSQIRRLSLFYCSIAVSELLSTLTNMGSLEVLQLGYMELPNPHINQHRWPTVTLPRLKRLFISDTVQTLNIFLGHMALPLAVCLFADSRSYEPNIDPPTSDDFSIFGKSLVAYFQNHSVQKCQANMLSCAMESELLIVGVLQVPEVPFPTHIPRHQFTFNTGPISPGPLPAHALVCTILRSFASSDLSNITILEIDLVNSTLDRSDVDLISFLKALVKVEEIRTRSVMLQMLLDITSDGFILLPSLHTIYFNSSEDLKSDVIMRFLLQRRDSGVPIKTFDLTSCSSSAPFQLLFLEEIEGLVVRWNQEMRHGIEE
ncbi:hypothetical protein GALMADRAFT_208021 [Galerina marginata CBS 339.88]|uniref:F-box domain-containing protein n=1 Tax=Galerina marginata (strain CBS 339.88) TaxID=685588 RepID=A0A067TDF7_GALM3|nr:hypothetical protein GALMADRAFT_208021 [Galerina marginata CBS 339.88]